MFPPPPDPLNRITVYMLSVRGHTGRGVVLHLSFWTLYGIRGRGTEVLPGTKLATWSVA